MTSKDGGGGHIPGLRNLRPDTKKEKIQSYAEIRPDLRANFEAELASVRSIARVVLSGPFPGIGSAHVDLSSAFAWRFLQLLGISGITALVLPRNSLIGAGLKAWRKEVRTTANFSEVATLVNNRHWVFEGVDPRYAVTLVTISRSTEETEEVAMVGPLFGVEEFNSARNGTGVRVPNSDLEEWSALAAFPNVPTRESLEILKIMMPQGRLPEGPGSGMFRPYAELNASSDKGLFKFRPAEGPFEAAIYGGSSFNIWQPDSGEPYAVASTAEIEKEMRRRYERATQSSRSVYYGLNPEAERLPHHAARIAYRQITNPTNSRTVIAALLPPGTLTVHSAPVIVGRNNANFEEAFLLGVLSSIPFDWVARRWVEMNLTMELLSGLPVPWTTCRTELGMRVQVISGRLAAVDDRFSDWAAEVGVPVGSVKSEEEKNELICELDALVSLLYGLTEEHVVHIFETFHRGWDYQPRLEKVLGYYGQWKDKA